MIEKICKDLLSLSPQDVNKLLDLISSERLLSLQIFIAGNLINRIRDE